MEARETGVVLMGVGLFLPLLGGGNVLFTLEPAQAVAYLLLIALGAALVLGRVAGASSRRDARSSLQSLLLLAFVSCWIAALLLRPFGPRSLLETEGLLCGVLLYAAVSGCALSREAFEKLMIGLLLGTLGTALYAQYQYWVAFPTVVPLFRARGLDATSFVNANFYNANAYAAFLGAAILLSTPFLGNGRLSAAQHIVLPLVLLLVWTLLLTRSRSTIAILVAVVIARELWTGAPATGGWVRRGRVLGVAGVFVVAAAALFPLIDVSELWTVGWNGRIAIWRASFSMIRDNWATGVGLGRFADYFPQYQRTGYYTRYPHSFFLEVFAELGIAGALSLAGFLTVSFARAIVRCQRSPRAVDERAVMVTLVCASGFLVAHAAVDIDWHAPANVVLLLIFLGAAQARWSPASSGKCGGYRP